MSDGAADPRRFFRQAAAWRPLEFVVWPAAVACLFLFPNRLLLINDIAILGLFAVSLDLILGYAGIVSLGQGARLPIPPQGHFCGTSGADNSGGTLAVNGAAEPAPARFHRRVAPTKIGSNPPFSRRSP